MTDMVNIYFPSHTHSNSYKFVLSNNYNAICANVYDHYRNLYANVLYGKFIFGWVGLGKLQLYKFKWWRGNKGLGKCAYRRLMF